MGPTSCVNRTASWQMLLFQLLTTPNTLVKYTQHAGPNNIGCCLATMLGGFARALGTDFKKTDVGRKVGDFQLAWFFSPIACAGVFLQAKPWFISLPSSLHDVFSCPFFPHHFSNGPSLNWSKQCYLVNQPHFRQHQSPRYFVIEILDESRFMVTLCPWSGGKSTNHSFSLAWLTFHFLLKFLFLLFTLSWARAAAAAATTTPFLFLFCVFLYALYWML